MPVSQGRPVTADDLFHSPDDGYRYELVRGVLRQMTPAGARHGAVAMKVAVAIENHVGAHRLGTVLAADTGFVLSRGPDTVLAPDVAFVRQERIPATGMPVSFWEGAPDLAVEVLSPGDSWREARDKAATWLDAGARAVWLVDPRSRTIERYQPGRAVQLLSALDVVEEEDVLPGFRLALAEVFPE